MFTLQFKIHSNASRCYIDRWNELKNKCEHGNTKELATEWRQNCQLETNRALPFISRAGGILGCPKKYISFRLKLVEWWQNDVFIVFDQIHNSYPEKWDLEELDDLRYAFQKLCNKYVKADLVKGYLKCETVVIST